MPDTLFSPLTIGDLTLRNRVVMAPLTRSRAATGGVPTSLNAQYYQQRATAGLIISEATNISLEGRGYAFTPGIFTDEQVDGWQLVTEAVHDTTNGPGGLIFCQLWHVGRISHPDLQPGFQLPVAPSAVLPKGQAFTEDGMKDHVTPRALETNEIARVIEDYRHATRMAKKAGFDGVEIHAANGYLIEQFLRDSTNKRQDQYGGSIENRVRFMREVVEAVVGEWSADRVGIRLSPISPANDMAPDSNPHGLYTYAVQELNKVGLAYLHMVEGATGGARVLAAEQGGFDLQQLADKFENTYMANNGYDRQLALNTVAHHHADLVAFGKPFIANPDLVARLEANVPLSKPNPKTFYGGGAEGYTDYPVASAEEFERARAV